MPDLGSTPKELSLHDLLAFLVEKGFDIDETQHQSLELLQTSLAHNGKTPETLEDWRPWLGPIVCGSREEQRRFDELFTSWSTMDRERRARQSRGSDTNISEVNETKKAFLPRLIFLIGLLLIALVFYFFGLARLEGRITDLANGNPIENVSLRLMGRHVKTDEDGRYRFDFYTFERPRGKLAISSLGYRGRDVELQQWGTHDFTMAREEIQAPTGEPEALYLPIADIDDRLIELAEAVWRRVLGQPYSTSAALVLLESLQSLRSQYAIRADSGRWRSRMDQLEEELDGFPDSSGGGLEGLVEEINLLRKNPAAVYDPHGAYRELYDQARRRHVLSWLLFIICLVILIRHVRFQAFARHGLVDAEPEDMVRIPEQSPMVFTPREVTDLNFAMASAHTYTSRRLDVMRTVEATVRQSGVPRLYFQEQHKKQQYLVLIEQGSSRDHQARLARIMIDQLASGGLAADLFFFEGDLQKVCSPGGDSLDMRGLLGVYPDHRLMIFADVSCLLDPLTGNPNSWNRVVTSWSEPVLFSPRPENCWGPEEQQISELGIAVKAFSPAAFKAHYLEGGAIHPESMPAPLTQREFLEAEEDPRLPHEHADLLADLEVYLGGRGLFWLGACAVYPHLRWEWTLYLGHHLKDERGGSLFSPLVLRKLCRLPWFQRGTMPEWVRADLCGRLDDHQREEVRRVLGHLLGSHHDSGIPTLYLKNHPSPLRPRLDGQTEPAYSPMRDKWFFLINTGRRHGNRGLGLPRWLRYLLFPGGNPFFGPRLIYPLISMVILVFLADRLPPLPDPPILTPRFALDRPWSSANVIREQAAHENARRRNPSRMSQSPYLDWLEMTLEEMTNFNAGDHELRLVGDDILLGIKQRTNESFISDLGVDPSPPVVGREFRPFVTVSHRRQVMVAKGSLEDPSGLPSLQDFYQYGQVDAFEDSPSRVVVTYSRWQEAARALANFYFDQRLVVLPGPLISDPRWSLDGTGNPPFVLSDLEEHVLLLTTHGHTVTLPVRAVPENDPTILVRGENPKDRIRGYQLMAQRSIGEDLTQPGNWQEDWPKIEEGLGDADPDVRKAVLELIDQFAPFDPFDQAIEMVGDPNREVALTALAILYKRGHLSTGERDRLTSQIEKGLDVTGMLNKITHERESIELLGRLQQERISTTSFLQQVAPGLEDSSHHLMNATLQMLLEAQARNQLDITSLVPRLQEITLEGRDDDALAALRLLARGQHLPGKNRERIPWLLNKGWGELALQVYRGQEDFYVYFGERKNSMTKTYFSNQTGDTNRLPNPGDILKATQNMKIRVASESAEQVAWVATVPLDELPRGTSIRVLETIVLGGLGTIQRYRTSPVPFVDGHYWMRFSLDLEADSEPPLTIEPARPFLMTLKFERRGDPECIGHILSGDVQEGDLIEIFGEGSFFGTVRKKKILPDGKVGLDVEFFLDGFRNVGYVSDLVGAAPGFLVFGDQFEIEFSGSTIVPDEGEVAVDGSFVSASLLRSGDSWLARTSDPLILYQGRSVQFRASNDSEIISGIIKSIPTPRRDLWVEDSFDFRRLRKKHGETTGRMQSWVPNNRLAREVLNSVANFDRLITDLERRREATAGLNLVPLFNVDYPNLQILVLTSKDNARKYSVQSKAVLEKEHGEHQLLALDDSMQLPALPRTVFWIGDDQSDPEKANVLKALQASEEHDLILVPNPKQALTELRHTKADFFIVETKTEIEGEFGLGQAFGGLAPGGLDQSNFPVDPYFLEFAKDLRDWSGRDNVLILSINQFSDFHHSFYLGTVSFTGSLKTVRSYLGLENPGESKE